MAEIKNAYLLGSDTKITQNDQGTRELAVSNGDLDFTGYQENIIGAINRRLFSIFQELITHPDYGGFISSYVSDLTNFDTINLILVQMRQEMLKDPRIEDVLSLESDFSKINRTLTITYSFETITQQVLDNIVFEIKVGD